MELPGEVDLPFDLDLEDDDLWLGVLDLAPDTLPGGGPASCLKVPLPPSPPLQTPSPTPLQRQPPLAATCPSSSVSTEGPATYHRVLHQQAAAQEAPAGPAGALAGGEEQHRAALLRRYWQLRTELLAKGVQPQVSLPLSVSMPSLSTHRPGFSLGLLEREGSASNPLWGAQAGSPGQPGGEAWQLPGALSRSLGSSPGLAMPCSPSSKPVCGAAACAGCRDREALLRAVNLGPPPGAAGAPHASFHTMVSTVGAGCWQLRN